MGETHASSPAALLFSGCLMIKVKKKGKFPNQSSINRVDTLEKMKMVGFVLIKVTFQKKRLQNQ